MLCECRWGYKSSQQLTQDDSETSDADAAPAPAPAAVAPPKYLKFRSAAVAPMDSSAVTAIARDAVAVADAQQSAVAAQAAPALTASPSVEAAHHTYGDLVSDLGYKKASVVGVH